MSAKATAWAELARRDAELSAACATLFDFGETAWREYRSAAWYVAFLEREGFTVEAGTAGMPTAFAARWSNGSGPRIGLYAEYDGIPGNGQAPVPYESPRPGLSPLSGGHTDPHSALGIAGLGGALALKAAMTAHGIGGSILFTGEPAEKVRGSKPIHAAAGIYDGVDAFLSFHPAYMSPLYNTVRWETHCGASYSAIWRFVLDDRPDPTGAPIPQAHSAARSPGAQEALTRMHLLARAQQSSMLPFARGWSLSEAVLVAGQATADNLPARETAIQFLVRTSEIAECETVIAALDGCARAAAASTGCRVERHWVTKSRPGLANHAMARVVWANLQEVGAPAWGEDALVAANAVRASLGVQPVADPFLPDLSTLLSPEDAEAALRRDLPPSQLHSTSDDYTEMTWHAPTARFYVGRAMLRDLAAPAWAMNALGGMPATIDPTWRVASRVLAGAAIDLLTRPELLAAAKAEFDARTGGGIGGTQWIAPLCDYPAPIHWRWPEYVTTPRGREWWIPALPADLRGVDL